MNIASDLKQQTSIRLSNISKKFGSTWIFKNISVEFEAGKKYAITGPNGSGKSTLLKIIAGIITPHEGKTEVIRNKTVLSSDELFKEISFCAPYMELPEELTLAELLTFHTNLRPIGIRHNELINQLQIEPDKEIRNYSSGMKQRLKLALAFYTQSSILLLDEPASTLDEFWMTWYLKTVQAVSVEKIIIISSNMPAEYAFCNNILNILDYKK